MVNHLKPNDFELTVAEISGRERERREVNKAREKS
jgi:hypothetical protein